MENKTRHKLKGGCKMKLHSRWNSWLPIVAIILGIILQIVIPDRGEYPVTSHAYYTYFLILVLVVYVVLNGIAVVRPKLQEKLTYKGWFFCGVFILLSVYNLITVKSGLLPVLYFPSLNSILGVLVEDRELLVKCLGYSGRLLFYGYLGGVLFGFTTGILIGFNKKVSYWLSPVIRVLGPIPSTAWIPIVLICFPTAVSASAFLIALAVWFPTTVMTSSGISNIQNSYFEAGSTLGAGYFTKIFKIGIPAAMPHMFLGLFNGTCASFITLMTAEMIGAKYGIGWYVNWQKDMLSFSNVYAGLIVIAVTFTVLITVLFRLRDHLLVWQKGVIKW